MSLAPRPERLIAPPLAAYFAIFTLSGFSGLIYESIWAHYLKLLLGHAAYAQTLVLAIFMGGMAAGAWIAARRSAAWGNLLLGYAAVEALVGVAAILYHPLFVGVVELLHGRVVPALGDPGTVDLVKWTVAAASILPQAVLLGMTFPLMTAGLLRRHPENPGRAIATLYFCNSLGAAIGVLASGFWLIAAVGLPGTMLTAGLINLWLAAVVWLLERRPAGGAPRAPAASDVAPAPRADAAWLGWLAVAFGTGLASFVYEIGWIRMLSLVLGAATHSFELMLSAFILGLALGGLWIRARIDRLAEPAAFLAGVQIVMGLAALASLAVYGHAFAGMKWLLDALARSDGGYALFMLGSHGLSLAVMLPATFCAGMTLPLITHVLLARGCGEGAIGGVYAANTVGAILGVVLMVHFGMPVLGLRDAMIAGAALDLALGIAILAAARPRRAGRLAAGATVSVAAVLATVTLVQLDPHRMASGVYRYARARLPADHEILYHRDGKTATVNLIRLPSGRVSITTNGKPDAAINMAPDAEAAPDEPTMVLAAALPLALRPHARTAANIGMGSGLTTATLLAHSGLERVDTIEIEAAMVEAARGFRPRVDRAYEDPRSRIYIEDAKTFFAARGRRYDLVVSEPSNPWVSGVASLFSTEFYDLVKRYLAEDGVLVQWLQIYEIDVPLVASVVNALGEHFADYVIYMTDDVNILIVAANGGDLETLDAGIFAEPALAAELTRVGVNDLSDLRVHRVASRALLDPLFASYRAPANSDYHPFVDQNAARTRFLKRDAWALIGITDGPLPALRLLDPHHGPPPATLTRRPNHTPVRARLRAQAVLDVVVGGAGAPPAELGETLAAHAALLAFAGARCEPGLAGRWLDAVFRVAVAVTSHLTPPEAARLWAAVRTSPCAEALPEGERSWLPLIEAALAQDAAGLARHAERLLETQSGRGDERHGYLVAALMLGRLAGGDAAGAVGAWERYAAARWTPDGVNVHLRLLLSNAVYRMALGAHGASPAP